jgi:mRNA interferase RelE/StbE
MYQVKVTPTFEKDVKKLDSQIAKRIIQKIEYLAKNPKDLSSPIKYLPKELEGLRKFRIGDWRVYFWINDQKKEIILYGVEHRAKAYKRF